MKKLLIILSTLLCLLILCTCKKQKTYSRTFFAMNTYITVSAENDDSAAYESAEELIKQLETIFSRTDSESEIYAVNNGKTNISDELKYVLEKSSEIARNTAGAFNPCLGLISELWDITGRKHIPSDEEISALLPFCKPDNYSVDGNTVTKQDKTVIDLGASAKGYTAQRIIGLMKALGYKNAYVSIGGNIGVTGGTADSQDGKWKIGIRNPFLTDDTIGYINCTDKIISVSGDYERFFERDGIIYHHIFDTVTGKPARSGIKSTVVIADDGLVSDALSTALFVMGPEKALKFYGKHLYDFEAVLITYDGKVYLTDGIRKDFCLYDDAYFDGKNYLALVG